MPSEPPDADPHVRWCGGRRGELGAYPMGQALASEMLAQGASLQNTGQVLRHRHLATTAIYATSI